MSVFIAGAGEIDTQPSSGRSSLDLLATACRRALTDSGRKLVEIDGFLTGYSLTDGHFMVADAAAEYMGLQPAHCATINLGGATGCALVRHATAAIESGLAQNVLVGWADNRESGVTRSRVISRLSEIAHPIYELPYKPTIPAQYALCAARYIQEYDSSREDLAEVAVHFRENAVANPYARMSSPLTVSDVIASKPIAPPLHMLDCCLVTDFGGALVLTADDQPRSQTPMVRVAGSGEAHLHDYISEADSLTRSGASRSVASALSMAQVRLEDLDFAQLYDCFTIAILIQIEDIGLAPRGEAAEMFREGHFDMSGELPLNTNGGMLSAITGGIHHVTEAVRQLQGRSEGRQVPDSRIGLVHGLGGIMSSHCSLVLERHTL